MSGASCPSGFRKALLRELSGVKIAVTCRPVGIRSWPLDVATD